MKLHSLLFSLTDTNICYMCVLHKINIALVNNPCFIVCNVNQTYINILQENNDKYNFKIYMNVCDMCMLPLIGC